MLEVQIPTVQPEPRKRGILFVFIGVAALLLIGLGVFMAWRYFDKPKAVVPTIQNTVEVNSMPVVNIPEVNVNSDLVNQAPKSPDLDQDGLTAEEEIQYGTSDHAMDTDQDLLNDREEIKIYVTNPLKSDTDGDGYGDGEEVRNLYNPNGPGKLFNLNDIQR